jgi:death-on-curing protein
MIRHLTVEEVLELHRLVLEQSGGLGGVQDLGGLDSALAQPQMAFGGQELYPSLADHANEALRSPAPRPACAGC